MPEQRRRTVLESAEPGSVNGAASSPSSAPTDATRILRATDVPETHAGVPACQLTKEQALEALKWFTASQFNSSNNLTKEELLEMVRERWRFIVRVQVLIIRVRELQQDKHEDLSFTRNRQSGDKKCLANTVTKLKGMGREVTVADLPKCNESEEHRKEFEEWSRGRFPSIADSIYPP